MAGKRLLFLSVLIFYLTSNLLHSSEKFNPDLSFGTKAYMAYEAVYNDIGEDENSFQVRRAYLTMKAKLVDFLSFRMTLDVYNDDDGVESRMKYLYADFKLPDFSIITKPHVEFGIVHTPWLDFEEHINWYRMQGTMFMEREHLFNSADFGVTFMGYIGGLVDEEYQKEVTKKYPGRYGSFAFGVYDGGGYHNFEANNNKLLQGRLTLRPLPDIIPGLQFSYLGIYGKVNNEVLPTEFHSDWMTNAGMVSYEHKYFALTCQYVAGKGNKKGNMIEIIRNEADEIQSVESDYYQGFSLFGEIKLGNHWRVIGRYDHFIPDTEQDDLTNKRLIAGVGYDFGSHNMLILDFDQYKTFLQPEADPETNLQPEPVENTINAIKLTMQVSF